MRPCNGRSSGGKRGVGSPSTPTSRVRRVCILRATDIAFHLGAVARPWRASSLPMSHPTTTDDTSRRGRSAAPKRASSAAPASSPDADTRSPCTRIATRRSSMTASSGGPWIAGCRRRAISMSHFTAEAARPRPQTGTSRDLGAVALEPTAHYKKIWRMWRHRPHPVLASGYQVEQYSPLLPRRGRHTLIPLELPMTSADAERSPPFPRAARSLRPTRSVIFDASSRSGRRRSCRALPTRCSTSTASTGCARATTRGPRGRAACCRRACPGR